MIEFIFSKFLGGLLIAAGIIAIIRQQARGSAEFEAEKSYSGRSAVLIGAAWILLGLGFILWPNLMR